MKTIAIALSDDILDELEEECDKVKTNKSVIIQKCLEKKYWS